MNNPANSSMSLEHPMLNPVILSTLFEKVPVADLHSCRLVSKLWQSTSTPQWRSRARLQICCDRVGGEWKRRAEEQEEVKRNAWGDPVGKGDERLTLDQFLELLRSAQAESDYKLWSIPFRRSCHLVGDESQVGFFELYGSHLKDVHLKIFKDSNNPDFQRILLELTPNLERLKVVGDLIEWAGVTPSQDPFTTPAVAVPLQENLKVFCVDLCSKRMDGYELGSLRFWLRHFPNIQTLKVKNLVRGPDLITQNLPFVRLMAFIGDVRKESGYKRLPIAHLHAHKASFGAVRLYPGVLVDSFRKANLPLKTLKIDVGFDTEEAVVQEILQMHSSTLETLHILRGELNEPLKDFLGNDVSYLNLKDLTLAGAVARNFNFLRNTPNLEVLRHSKTSGKLPVMMWGTTGCNIVDGFMIKAAASNQNLDIRLERMKELHGDFKIDSGAMVERLAGWMPNLEILDLPLNKETFPAVCKSSWGGTLRQLSINLCKKEQASDQHVDDETLTGIPRGWPKRHSRFLMEDRPPNITNLKLLEVFTDTHYQSKSLSNHSVCNGFLHLPRLKSMNINVMAEQVKLSSPNQSKLMEKDVSLQFRQSEN